MVVGGVVHDHSPVDAFIIARMLIHGCGGSGGGEGWLIAFIIIIVITGTVAFGIISHRFQQCLFGSVVAVLGTVFVPTDVKMALENIRWPSSMCETTDDFALFGVGQSFETICGALVSDGEHRCVVLHGAEVHADIVEAALMADAPKLSRAILLPTALLLLSLALSLFPLLCCVERRGGRCVSIDSVNDKG